MTTGFRRPMLVLGTTILVMQAVFMPVGMVYAETTMDTEEQELMELPPMKNYLEEKQISDPRFFFTRSRMQGTAEEPLQVTFFSDQEVSEARVFLPEEATLLKDQLPTGISVEEGAQPNEWIVQSERAQHTFVLPLVVEQVGNYELSVEETTAHLEISEKEETSEEVPVEEMESSENDPSFEKDQSIESYLTGESLFDAPDDWNAQPIDSTTVIPSDYFIPQITNSSRVKIGNQIYNIPTTFNNISKVTITSVGMYKGKSVDMVYEVQSPTNGSVVSRSNGIPRGTVFFFNRNIQKIYFVWGDTEEVIRDIKIAFNHGPTANWGNAGFTYSYTSKEALTGILFPRDSLVGWGNSESDYIFLFGSTIVPSNKPVSRLSTVLLLDLSKTNGYLDVKVNSSSLNLSYRMSPQIPMRRLLESPNIYGDINDQDFGEIKFSIDHILFYDRNFPTLNYELRVQIADILLLNSEDIQIRTENNQDITSLFNVTVDNNNQLSMTLKADADISLLENAIFRTEIAATVDDSKQLAEYIEIVNDIQYIATSHSATAFVNMGQHFEQILQSDIGVSKVAWPKNVGPVGPVDPLDPLDPEKEVDPENKPELPEDQGQLSIDFISSFDFGSQAISVQDQIYYAKPQRLLNEDGTVNETEERPNYVQISDRRSENERNGWTLAVTQKEQFKGAENQVLNGASLSLSNQQVITAQGGTAPGLQSVPCSLVPGNRRTLLHAQGSEGTGTWIYRFGDGETAGESVALDVPRGANPEATIYSSTLIWELSAVPGN
ncbi:WxL domain-containing protein [Enterococcus casseliflavus]|uniref:WxL domain-containing protein n=1 Tax=Enterococcus casseliflavus TaxID=37734 RepID=UPI00232DBE67|nr:WxL domain-containing protein [Enterococcus casseliflavus]MDB1690094.1 WxL domain-containing protein [Enterococcus casseliflavus]